MLIKKIINNFLVRPNRWYDKQKEPFRFLISFVPFVILIVLANTINPQLWLPIGLFGLWRISYFLWMVKK